MVQAQAQAQAERGEIGTCKCTDLAGILCNGPLHVSGGEVVCGWCGRPQEGHPFTKDKPAAGPVPEPGIKLEAHAMGYGDRILALERKVAAMEQRLASMPTKKGA
jgi:hypothetical protein